MDLTIDICLRASELPPIHGDPCDRFIIATALQQNAFVVTADKRFHQYGVEVLM
jgi:PIN domain nuclease of toxin-antitoxin system